MGYGIQLIYKGMDEGRNQEDFVDMTGWWRALSKTEL